MKVLVTGAGGFVGRYVTRELVKRGLTPVISGRRFPENLDHSVADKVHFVQHDLQESTEENLFKKFGEPDVVIHLAWGGLPDFKNMYHVQTELPAQKRFCENLISHGLKSLTVTGTCLEYGMQEGELSEDTEPKPTTPYAIAKNELRLYLEDLQKNYDFHLKWVRLFYMYGKGQSPKSILAQLDAAFERNDQVFNMSEGEQWRDYLPVETVAENVVIFALQRHTGGIINCSSNNPVSIKRLVQEHLQKRGKSIALNTGFYPYPDYEPFRFWGNNKKQQSILQNEPDRTI